MSLEMTLNISDVSSSTRSLPPSRAVETNNNSFFGWNEECPPSVSGATFLVMAYSVVIAVGLVGNACLVLVIVRQREMHNVTNILIANLSCSDILVCVVCLPTTVAYTIMDRWVLGKVLCKFSPFVQCTSVTVSFFSMVLIALERHQLIVHPTGWTPVVRHSYLAVAITWLVACLLSLPFFCFHILTNDPYHNLPEQLGLFSDHLVCIEEWPSNQLRLAYTTSLLVLQYCLPLSVIFFCYLRIFQQLQRRKGIAVQRAWCQEAGPMEVGQKVRGAWRISGILAAIVASFAFCWLPLTVFNTLFDWYDQALPDCTIHDAVFSACHLAAMASTCINPIFYGFLNSNFKKELCVTMRRCWCPRASRHWGVHESYDSSPLSTVGTDVTKSTALCRGSPNTQAHEHAVYG
ncbi:neuropeptide Y receptor type 1-like [Scleropages formosus]|uniref:Neuropeptide Y receptor Y8a n=1 Tax=Scleropages formosus TaxID=113540 RepID=A0A0P7TAU3_SCLFO|nr:neuropeptide Y receptor type 6-like [Scleropages formosus]KPP58100.1 neuropeptide Y receptor type 1-like [Scleropages formosus]